MSVSLRRRWGEQWSVDAAAGFQQDLEELLTTELGPTTMLSKLKQVDGTGSGLDADTLDGNDSSFFYAASNPNGYITSSSLTPYALLSGAAFSGAVTSSSPSAGVGYATGAGGAVTQLTNKSTNVTLNALSGEITMNNASLAAGAIVSFSMINSSVGAKDLIILNHVTTGTLGGYLLDGQCASGAAGIIIRNNTAGALAEAIVIRFAIIKGVTA